MNHPVPVSLSPPCPQGNSHQNLKYGWSALHFTKPLVFTIAQAGGYHHWRQTSAGVERGRAARVQIPALPLPICVFGQSLNLSVPHFPHMKTRDDNNNENSTFFGVGDIERLNELIRFKHLAQVWYVAGTE